MQVLILSIIAKCGVFSHVKDLATYLKKIGIKPLIGLVNDSKTKQLINASKQDISAMEKALNGIPYFYYDSDSSLLEKVKDMEIDIIHAHSPLVLRHAVKMKAVMHVPFIITLHGAMNWNRYHGAELEFTDSIIAIGPEVAYSCGSKFQEKINIIFNGIDTEYFKPIDEKMTDNTSLRIVWTGRTSGTASHGAGCLSTSISILRKMGIPIEAKILGYPVGADVQGIEYCGWVHDPLPILQWSNMAFGRGRSLREAMACGNAGFLLAEGYGSLVYSKWFEDGRQPQLSGSLKHGYTELNSTHIAKDIMYFYEHIDHLQEVRIEARQIAKKHFDIKKMVDKTCRVYEQVISHKIR